MVDEHFLADSNASRMGTEQEFEKMLSNEQDIGDTAGDQAPVAARDAPIKAQEPLSSVLHFLSTASNETLGACIVGLGAITYLVLGRVGLILIGVVGGIVLHATWEEGSARSDEEVNSKGNSARRKREDGLNVLQRVLDWRDTRLIAESEANEGINELQARMSAQKRLDFSNFEPSTGAALTGLTDAVIRDYVKYMPLYFSPKLD